METAEALIKCSYRGIPLRFRKAGRVWCGGAQETQESFSNLPAFLNPNTFFTIALIFKDFERF